MPSRGGSDFREIHDRFSRDGAAEQAGRCEQCGIPFCQIHCPLHNNIPDWLRMTAEDRLEEAYELASATNNMPEICGRICPQDRLCEGNCVIEKGFESVTIGAVEKHITDTAFESGWVKPTRPVRERPESIGVIGAGPAGLAVADQLRKRGYQIDVYDRYDRVGGLLIYGIPNFKLDKGVVQRRADVLSASGIRFHLDSEVGTRLPFDELRARHDALFIGTGVYRPRDIAMPGAGLANIVQALDYLTASNRKGLRDAVPAFDSGALNAAGKRVVVIGGGDTAMDCVRTAVRQGAVSVRCLYRRDRANMPGSMREVRHAEEEGVEFVWQAAPEAFLGDGEVDGVRAVRMRLGAPDATGRQRPEPVPDSSFAVEADLVIKALGFDPEDLPTLFGQPELPVTRWGTVRIDWRTMMTAMAGVFAGGDIVRGASLVVWGVRDGRDAADAMHAYLEAGARRPGSGVGLLRRNDGGGHELLGRPLGRRLPAQRRASGGARPVRSERRARRLRRRLRRRDRRQAAARGGAGRHRRAARGLAPRRGRRRRQDRRRRRHPSRDRAGLLQAADPRRQGCRGPDRGRHGVPAAHRLQRPGALPHDRRDRGPGLRLQHPRLAPGAGRHLRDRREGDRHPARDRADRDRQPEGG